ncbi:MAG: HEAT repeat domain-containing protein [Candidatus Thorarchaeota archaeon]
MIGELLDKIANANDKKALHREISSLGLEGDENAIKLLITILNEGDDVEIKSYATQALVKIGGRDVVAQLIKSLRNENWVTRMKAAEALGEIKNKKAVNPLIKLLRTDPQPSVREWAAIALGNIGSRKATKSLIYCMLQNENMEVRMEAATALGKIGNKKSLNALLQAYQSDTNYNVRWMAASSIVKIDEINSQEIIEDLTENLMEIVTNEKDEMILGAAAKTLGEIGDEIAAKVLYKTMKISKEMVKLEINLALGKMAKRFNYRNKDELVDAIKNKNVI